MVLTLVFMHALTGTFWAEIMAYVGQWRANEMQHI